MSIEFIMFHERVLENSDITRYEFSAVSNRMSDLFYTSSSVKDWFVELGKISGALVVFFDVEFSDSILYSDPEKISVYFEDDYYEHLDHNQFCETIANTASGRGDCHPPNSTCQIPQVSPINDEG